MSEILQVPDNSGNNAWPLAAMMNGGMNNGWANNPFAYLMFLPFMYGMTGGGWGGNGWGNRGYGNALEGADVALGATTQANVSNLATQVQGLGNQIQDNQNFNQLNQSIGQTQSQLGDINGAMIGGFANLAQDVNGVQSAIQTTGCGIKSAILEQGYQNQLANCQQTNTILQQAQGLSNTMQTGFTQLGFQLERNACDVKETSTANTQKIVDTLNNHWNLEQQTTIQQLRDEVGRYQQTNTILSAIASGGTGTGGNSVKATT